MADVYDDWYAGVTDVGATVAALVAAGRWAPGRTGARARRRHRSAGPPARRRRAGGARRRHQHRDARPAAGQARAQRVGPRRTATWSTTSPAGPFDVVFVAYNTLFNLTTSGRAAGACFAPAAARLAPAGTFVVEAFVPDGPARRDAGAPAMAGPHDDAPTAVVLSVTTHDPIEQTGERSVRRAHRRRGGVRLRPWRDPLRRRPPSSTRWPPTPGSSLTAPRWEGWRTGEPFDVDSTTHVSVYGGVTTDHCDGDPGRPVVVWEDAVSQLRLNPLTGRWVTIVAERAERARRLRPRRRQVEADPARGPVRSARGNEEVDAARARDLRGATVGGWCGSCPTCYPAFDGDEPMTVSTLGPVYTWPPRPAASTRSSCYSPDHGESWADLDDRARRARDGGLRDRLEEHARRRRIRYTQAIVNHGREAGASLAHPHGQLLGLPFVPGEILDEERAFARFEGSLPHVHHHRGRARRRPAGRVRRRPTSWCVCPFWSGSPFEMLVIPRTPRAAPAGRRPRRPRRPWAGPIRDVLARLRGCLGDVAYNLGLPHRAAPPRRASTTGTCTSGRSSPRVAGFERGTGVLINIMPPEVAAADACARRPARLGRDADRRPGRDRHDAPPARSGSALEPIETPRRVDGRRRVDPLHHRAAPRRRDALRLRHARSVRSASSTGWRSPSGSRARRWACATPASSPAPAGSRLDADRRSAGARGSRGPRSCTSRGGSAVRSARRSAVAP